MNSPITMISVDHLPSAVDQYRQDIDVRLPLDTWTAFEEWAVNHGTGVNTIVETVIGVYVADWSDHSVDEYKAQYAARESEMVECSFRLTHPILSAIDALNMWSGTCLDEVVYIVAEKVIQIPDEIPPYDEKAHKSY
jgi:hypothetical protein